MKNTFIIILSFAIVSFANGQAGSNLFSILSSAKERIPVDPNVISISQYNYNIVNADGSEKSDTTITLNGKELALNLADKAIMRFPEPNKIVKMTYSKDGALNNTIMAETNKSGLVVYEGVDFGDTPAAAMMNSETVKEYDEKDRLKKVIKNGEAPMAAIEYMQDGNIQSMDMNLIFKGSTKAQKIGDTLRYEIKLELDPEMKAMMGDKEMPKEHYDVVSDANCNCRKIHVFKEGEEGKMNLENIFFVNDNFETLEEQSFDQEGQIVEHIKYEYLSEGKVKKTTNVLTNYSMTNEYDENENPLVIYTRYQKQVSTYDDKGNLLMEYVSDHDEDYISDLSFYKTVYK